MKLTTSTLLVLAAFVAGCDNTPTPTTSTLTGPSAAPAPSMVGTPIAATPVTHTAFVPPVVDGELTSTDSTATAPSATLAAQDEKTAMPMAGHGNNHSSPALEAGKDEGEKPRS